jgi:hypothetical protein
VVPEFANSSDQTSVPEGILGVKLLVETLLSASPEAVAMAFTVMFEETRNGAVYGCEEAVGVEPSKV